MRSFNSSSYFHFSFLQCHSSLVHQSQIGSLTLLVKQMHSSMSLFKVQADKIRQATQTVYIIPAGGYIASSRHRQWTWPMHLTHSTHLHGTVHDSPILLKVVLNIAAWGLMERYMYALHPVLFSEELRKSIASRWIRRHPYWSRWYKGLLERFSVSKAIPSKAQGFIIDWRRWWRKCPFCSGRKQSGY